MFRSKVCIKGDSIQTEKEQEQGVKIKVRH